MFTKSLGSLAVVLCAIMAFANGRTDTLEETRSRILAQYEGKPEAARLRELFEKLSDPEHTHTSLSQLTEIAGLQVAYDLVAGETREPIRQAAIVTVLQNHSIQISELPILCALLTARFRPETTILTPDRRDVVDEDTLTIRLSRFICAALDPELTIDNNKAAAIQVVLKDPRAWLLATLKGGFRRETDKKKQSIIQGCILLLEAPRTK
ncbi:MAG: hypothetical protein HYZ53_12885 [Planctomycetes bacterium]|nr:hypothetical protein [Planctomycetota bacterium]